MSEEKKVAENKELSFEQALEKLESVVADMESGELSLSESMKRFEEGTKLAGLCTKKLGETEKKIEILVNKNKDAEPEWKSFGDEDTDDGEAAGQVELGLV